MGRQTRTHALTHRVTQSPGLTTPEEKEAHMEMELTTLAYGLSLGASAALVLWAVPAAYFAATGAIRERIGTKEDARRLQPPMTRMRSFGL